MDEPRREFLAGERPDDVLIYLSETELADAGSSAEELVERGERIDGGVVFVLPGERGRSVFQRAVGVDPMNFAGAAMDVEGTVDPTLTGGACPADDGDEHDARFIFAFVEAQNEEVGGLYAEGPVVHAYVACTCGTNYSDRWVAGRRDDGATDGTDEGT